MLSRREAIRLSAGGLAAFGLGAVASRSFAKDTLWPFENIPASALNPTGIKVLNNAARIAIPSYRFGVVVRSGISASAGAGDVSMEATADLVGMGLEEMQQIANAAHSDFVTQIKETGREIVPEEEMRASKGWAKLQMTATPFIKKPFADARTVAMISANGLPLINQHSDSPISDQSPLALGNWRAINQMCVDLKCVVMIPSVVIDFAQMSGSGHKVYGTGARVGIQPGLYLVPLFTQLSAHFAKIAIAGPGGKIILKDRVTIGQAGELVQTSSHNNRAAVDWWNSVSSWDPNASPLSRPSSAYDYSSYEYQVDRALFAQACFDGTHAMNRIYADAANTYRPA